MSVSNHLTRMPNQENLELSLKSQVEQSQWVNVSPLTISGVEVLTELVISIFQQLHPRDIVSCMRVSDKFHSTATNFVN